MAKAAKGEKKKHGAQFELASVSSKSPLTEMAPKLALGDKNSCINPTVLFAPKKKRPPNDRQSAIARSTSKGRYSRYFLVPVALEDLDGIAPLVQEDLQRWRARGQDDPFQEGQDCFRLRVDQVREREDQALLYVGSGGKV